MLTCGSLFSGVGLMDYGLFLAGLRHAWFVESIAYRRGILARRYPGCEVHDDVRTFDAVRSARVDVIAGGFPCRGVSTAGQRTGLAHPETALWSEFARIVGDARPRYVVVENVANILTMHRGGVWGTVLGDLAALGYDAWWDCFPAAAFGAPHLRDRVFLVAHATGERRTADDAGRLARPEPRGGSDPPAADDPSNGRLDGSEWWPPERGARTANGSRLASDASEVGRGVGATEPLPVRRPSPRAGPSDACTSPCADRERLRVEPEPQSRSGGPSEPRRRAAAPADDHSDGRQEQPILNGGESARRHEHGRPRGAVGAPGFPWGKYAPAIHRWEEIAGPVPEPFLPRMAHGRPRGVDGSRVAALGDGVLVQAARYIGELLMALEDARTPPAGHAIEDA